MDKFFRYYGLLVVIICAIYGCVRLQRPSQNTLPLTQNPYDKEKLSRNHSQYSINSNYLTETPCNNSYYTGLTAHLDSKLQQLKIYNVIKLEDTYICELKFSMPVTTGKADYPTPKGEFLLSEVFSITINSHNVLWITFHIDGQEYFGIHTAPWQDQTKFGDFEFTKEFGSTGCVRIPFSHLNEFLSYHKPGMVLIHN